MRYLHIIWYFKWELEIENDPKWRWMTCWSKDCCFYSSIEYSGNELNLAIVFAALWPYV